VFAIETVLLPTPTALFSTATSLFSTSARLFREKTAQNSQNLLWPINPPARHADDISGIFDQEHHHVHPAHRPRTG
jgi:hypothetical protein